MPYRPKVEARGRRLAQSVRDAGLWGSYGREVVPSVRSTGPSFELWELGTPIQIRAAPLDTRPVVPMARPARGRPPS